jgi:hypothetical protein
VNVTPLTWSDTLANNAQSWCNHLASLGGWTLEHSRNNSEGENLWIGTSDAFNYTEMVDSWGEEKKYFINGTFPNVSSTENCSVGHYTQIIWQNTEQVGCAIARANGTDILVCRYNPPGNWVGQPIYGR